MLFFVQNISFATVRYPTTAAVHQSVHSCSGDFPHLAEAWKARPDIPLFTAYKILISALTNRVLLGN